MVMHRVIFARGVIRTAILIPYGIITVVSAFAWQFAFSLNNGFVNAWFSWLPWITPTPTGSARTGRRCSRSCVSEIWKTTPFMALLLLAGLSQVSEDMLEAAQVDGATWWQRLYKVILPNMRAAIMVAVLFRALDAFRIFDNIYIMTKGAQNTELARRSSPTHRSSSRLQLGLGSALSVLLFLSVLIIAFISSSCSRSTWPPLRGEGVMAQEHEHPDESRHLGRASSLILVWCLFPIAVDHVAVVQVRRRDDDGQPAVPPEGLDHLGQLQVAAAQRPSRSRLPAGAAQLVRHLYHLHGAGGDLRDASRPTPSPGWSSAASELVLSMALAIAMFPVVSLVGPLFNLWRNLGLFNTWLGLIIPYMSFTLPLAIWTLSAFFREIPWEMEQAAQVDGATSWQAFRKVIVPLAAPGVFTAAILTFFFAWNEFVLAISLTSTTALATVPAQLSFFVGPDPFNPPYVASSPPLGRRHDPGHHHRPVVPAQDRRRL